MTNSLFVAHSSSWMASSETSEVGAIDERCFMQSSVQVTEWLIARRFSCWYLTRNVVIATGVSECIRSHKLDRVALEAEKETSRKANEAVRNSLMFFIFFGYSMDGVCYCYTL
jgi:hypothetical protein